MTVRALIELLATQDQDAEVVLMNTWNETVDQMTVTGLENVDQDNGYYRGPGYVWLNHQPLK